MRTLNKNRRSVSALLLPLVFLLFAASSTAESKSSDIFLIRHAEKALDQGSDPELTPQGKQRATHWAQLLRSVELDAVYSTDTQRTLATAREVAQSQGLTVQLYSARPAQDDTFISQLEGKAVLLVGHSNTVYEWVNTLIGADRFTELDESQYGMLYIVTGSPGSAHAIALDIPLGK